MRQAGSGGAGNAVVLAADETYAKLAWVAARSAAAQPHRNFDVWLLTPPAVAAALPAAPGLNIRAVSLPAGLSQAGGPAHMSPFAYARLAAAELWLPDYDRLLYLDADTRLTGGLAPLFAL